jgi:hypothetical protein
MADYVDKSAQTIVAGLTKHPSSVPGVLLDATSTPPEDMPNKEPQEPYNPATSNMNNDDHTSPSLLLRRKNRPPLVARISLPEASDVDSENPRSPPPTEAVMSPLPAANKLHAGHTPIFPRSLSPLRAKESSGETTPQQDTALEGPLTLPAQPGDGAEDRIELKVLDAELEKIAKEQDIVEVPAAASSSIHGVGDGGQRSRLISTDGRRRSSVEDVEVVDGVLLKKPKMNMGAPLGQA